MTSLTLSALDNDPVRFRCARYGCEPISISMKALVDQLGLNTPLPDIARRLSCQDPDQFENVPCVISYAELPKTRAN